jgi:hypothetical protein
VHPDKLVEQAHYRSMGIEPLLEKAINNTEIVDFGADGIIRQ